MLAIEHAHALHRLSGRQREQRETLEQFQVRKLRMLVAHCRSGVAVYRDLWRASPLQPADITAPAAIEALPTIGKDALRDRPVSETLARGADPRRLVCHMTSGSSGQPFTIYRSSREEHLLNLFRVRASTAVGVRLFDRIARFSQLPLDGFRRGWPGRVRQALGIHREVRLDGLASAAAMMEQLARCRPDVVAGYPSTLLHVAAGMLQSGQVQTRPRLILCGGEVLDAAARRLIEEGFRAPLIDSYGAHEFNLLAWQCTAAGTYHVCDDNVLVEVLGDDGQPVRVGETGEVVATALHSYTMPFVRYRTGDLAIRGPDACPCGHCGATLRAVQGRAVDYLRLPAGRRVHPYEITGVLAEREAAWVLQHQIVQPGERHVVLNVHARGAPRPEDIERLRIHGMRVVGPGVRFDVALVDNFPRQPGHKFQPYVSLVGDQCAPVAMSIPDDAHATR